MEATDFYKTIGLRIAAARKLQDMTQDELAEKIGVHKQTLWRWEAGKRAPNGGELRELATVLDCSADFLLGLSDTLKVSR